MIKSVYKLNFLWYILIIKQREKKMSTLKTSQEIVEELTGETMGMIEACEENDDNEKCPFCGGSPIVIEGHDRTCTYCERWW